VRPVQLQEIVSLDRYADLRPAYREAVIRHKASRRLPVGDKVTLLFEDRETLLFQIQEMCWIERISDPEKIQTEIDVYNALVPEDHELSATLFIEITEMPEIRPELDRLVGIHEHVYLILGTDPVQACFDPKQREEDRISAVQYIRLPLGEAGARRLADPRVPARVRIDHPNYRCEVEVPEAMRASLCQGLAGETPPLLRADAQPASPAAPEQVLFETPRLRAVRPARPRDASHVVIEPRDEEASLLEADRDLLVEILEAVRRAASDVVRKHGRCRVHTDVGRDAGRPRWHVYAPER
jgi:hypothetical protein